MDSLSYHLRRILQPLVATVGLGLYALNPELGLLIMCASVLFEVDSEGTVYHSVLASRLRGALVKMGVNRPTATVICEGLFDPKSGSGAAYLSSGDYKIRAKSEYASKMLILENVVLLISGWWAKRS